MKLYKQVMAKYYPSGHQDGLNLYGVAAAQAFVQLIYKAGKNPTRASLMKAFTLDGSRTRSCLPGNRRRTQGVDQRPIHCLQLHEVHERHLPARLGAEVRTDKT